MTSWDHPRVCGEQSPSRASGPSARDHPRVCGEQPSALNRECSVRGSSPRVRGAGRRRVSRRAGRGIIPACAGSRPFWAAALPSRWDHPRVCGEQVEKSQWNDFSKGSSPRVRGAGRVEARQVQVHGIIPACAGSSRDCTWRRGGRQDHPRVCGEQSLVHPAEPREAGSSPRVRGAAARVGEVHRRAGIIPACAGSSLRPTSRLRFMQDHPRVCGEQLRDVGRLQANLGSSPRVRGAVEVGVGVVLHVGIIPACAGSSRTRPMRPTSVWDHPRVCGEQCYELSDGEMYEGSSPRVRGAAPAVPSHQAPTRIIPACAGSRRSRTWATAPPRDHPRVCGEQFVVTPLVTVGLGSSPRVRGAARLHEGARPRRGIIPACAGSSRV